LAAIAASATAGAQQQAQQATAPVVIVQQQQQPQVVQPAPQGTMQNPIIVQLHPETGGVPTPVAMSGPRQINDWEPEDPVPNGYHPETRARRA
jgi:hypothetical protein